MQIIDSHTGGEPTRTIISGGPELGSGTMKERLAVFQQDFDHVRRSLIHEPRGADVMVGALLCEPVDSDNVCGVIFFNNTGYLGMCGHGTIGLVVTLYHLGKIDLGKHKIETPVGVVEVDLLSPSQVKIENVVSYRFRKDVVVKVPEVGDVCGDIAWGGNWFFLVKKHQMILSKDNCEQLLDFTWRIRQALEKSGISGKNGGLIDHVELFAEPQDKHIADSKNFVLCPGREYDRSPCGTGTSAKLACLFEDGIIEQGQLWRQQSIIESIFEGSVRIVNGDIIPQITGEAFVTLEANVVINPEDPFAYGL